MQLALVRYTPNPGLTTESAVRLCFSPFITIRSRNGTSNQTSTGTSLFVPIPITAF